MGLPFLALAASVLAHAGLTRLAPGRNTILLFLASALIVGVALIGWLAWAFGLSIEILSAAAVYVAFCELYIFLFTLALDSVSANILVRLAAGPRSVAELDTAYDSASMVKQRLSRMQGAGFLTQDADAFKLTSRGAIVVRGYRFLRDVFRHDARRSG